ncbi:hypothetical protein ILUMI_24634 [Ignelater luminosus]|uniref:Uncharacterized protein n=1 Tax=Ignelater luminosus TaxID=2038154 RepID=A0A8K0CA41_IGNLU|nr:hypothetical protein ILUMI_24634 [Ignelater luminosus]
MNWIGDVKMRNVMRGLEFICHFVYPDQSITTEVPVPLQPHKLDDVCDDEMISEACANELDDGRNDYDPGMINQNCLSNLKRNLLALHMTFYWLRNTEKDFS